LQINARPYRAFVERAFEHAVSWIEAATGILDAYHNAVRFERNGANAEPALAIRDRRERVDAILHAIHQNLRQLATVATNGRQLRGKIEFERDAVGLELEAHDVDGPNDVVRLDRDAIVG
jgi:hypothetical protein